MGEVVEQMPFTRDWAAPYAVELVQPGCSKGNRLAQWAASEGVAMDQVVAFGDNNKRHQHVRAGRASGGHGQCGPADPEPCPPGSPPDHNEDGIALALQRWVLP